MKMKLRIGAAPLSGALLLGLFPAGALAAAEGVQDSGAAVTADGLCEHHPQHDESCGYVPATKGTPCAYVCEICNPQDSGEVEGANEPAPPSNAIDSTVTEAQGLIDALSDAETLAATSAGELQEVYAQVQAAYDAYEALTDEQKPQITGAEIFESLFAVFNSMANALEPPGLLK